MRHEVCKKCGLMDYYTRGDFSYCRPCHSEAQKRYMQRKAMGDEVTTLLPPAIVLADMVSHSSSKPKCSNGHWMTGDNVVMSSQRRGRHLRRRCLTCERNAKRIKYGIPIDPAPSKLTDLLDS